MGPTGCPEKSVTYQSTLRNVTEDEDFTRSYLTTSTKARNWNQRSESYSPITPLE